MSNVVQMRFIYIYGCLRITFNMKTTHRRQGYLVVDTDWVDQVGFKVLMRHLRGRCLTPTLVTRAHADFTRTSPYLYGLHKVIVPRWLTRFGYIMDWYLGLRVSVEQYVGNCNCAYTALKTIQSVEYTGQHSRMYCTVWYTMRSEQSFCRGRVYSRLRGSSCRDNATMAAEIDVKRY